MTTITALILSFLLLSFILVARNQYKQCVYAILFILSFSFLYSQSIQNIQRSKTEYDKYKQKQQQILGQDIDPENKLPQEATIYPIKPLVEKEEKEKIRNKYFGYDFFIRRDKVDFWKNLPTPANYLLGPGDELVISLWGETQLRETYTINRDGKIFDSKVGLLNISGKNIAETHNYIKIQFGRIYATLNGINPTTYLDISLGQLRSINVNFVGEVKFPGVHPVHPFSTVITGLIQAGGVNTSGSLRNIQIKRKGKPITSVDLYDYLITGELPQNIQLRDQDVVVVSVRLSTVTIDSAVVHPGIYEANPEETISMMINYAGGLKSNSSSTIDLKRIVPLEKRAASGSLYENFYFDYKNSQLLKVQDGDIITIRNMFSELHQVEIIGQIKKPGLYNYSEGITLKNLLILSGGFEDTTFWKSVYKTRCEIIRRDPNSRYEKVIEINLNNVMNGNSYADIELQNLDRIIIHANLNYFEKENIQILGEVNIPGSYPRLSDNESLDSFIKRAGGFTSEAFPEGIEIFRDTLRVAWENTSISLAPGDSVIVKERPGVVFVTGEVYNPGLIEYKRNNSLKKYIDSAGGITLNGNRNNIIVIYSNGIVKPKKYFSSPEIKDGATIIVNFKMPSEPFKITEFANTTISLLTSFLTIIIITKQLL